MFDYIEDSIIYFNGCKKDFANFHLAFLAGLISFLGFEPGVRTNADEAFFDMTNGKFVTMPPVHGNYAGIEISNILAALFSASYDSVNNILLTGKLRNEVLEILVRYYSLHLPGLRKIKSLEVLKEVFT